MSDKVFCCNCKWSRKATYIFRCHSVGVHSLHSKQDEKYQFIGSVSCGDVNKDGSCEFYKHSIRKNIYAYNKSWYPDIHIFKRLRWLRRAIPS